jgi:hypothetical protein
MYKLLIEWLRVKLNLEPDLKICEGCRRLELENAHLHNEINRLLDHILNPPSNETESNTPRVFNPILPKRGNWNTERMRLERLDMEKNNKELEKKALKAAGQKDPSNEEQKREEATNITAPSIIVGTNKTIEELENELSVELPDRAVGE